MLNDECDCDSYAVAASHFIYHLSFGIYHFSTRMLRLHETRRRFACQLAFVVLCALPTFTVGAWAVSRAWPGQSRAAAAQLREQVGLSVALDRVSHPRPGVVLYEGLALSDPETGEIIARCRLLEAAQGSSALVLRASQAEVQAARVDRLWELLTRLLRHELPGADTQVRFSANELTWHAPGQQAQTFIDVGGRLGPVTAGQEVELSFRLAGATIPDPATLRIVRHRPAPDSASRALWTGLSLHTGGAAVPCSVFSPLVAAERWFGARATFRGYLWGKDAPGGLEGEITGNLTDLDLDALVSAHFPHTLSGVGELQIEQARYTAGRLVEASGTLLAGPGVVSRSLIVAGAEHLRLGPGLAFPAADPVAYERLSLGFVADADGLQLTSVGAGDLRGAILVGASGGATQRMLWTQPIGGPQPLVGLVRMLVPASEVQVPATPQAEWLIGHLPLPPVVSPSASGSTREPPKARLRVSASPASDAR